MSELPRVPPELGGSSAQILPRPHCVQHKTEIRQAVELQNGAVRLLHVHHEVPGHGFQVQTKAADGRAEELPRVPQVQNRGVQRGNNGPQDKRNIQVLRRGQDAAANTEDFVRHGAGKETKVILFLTE